MLDFNRRGDLESFGYYFIAPVVSAYFNAVLKLVGSDIGNKKCFFLAREGYFLEKLFHIYCEKNGVTEKIESEYLMCSRSFLFKLALSDENLMGETLKHHYKGTFKSFLLKRYGLSGADLNKIVAGRFDVSLLNEEVKLPSQGVLIKERLKEVYTYIKSDIEEKRDLYEKYLKGIGFVDNDALIFDLGFSGTIQKLLSSFTNKNLDGHYMVTTKNAIDTARLKFHGHLASGASFGEGLKLLDRSLYLESILTAPHGQVVDITSLAGEIKFLFAPKTNAQKNFELLEKVVSGVANYIADTASNDLKLSKEDVIEYYSSFVSSGANFPLKIRNVLEVDDHISGFGVLNPTQLFG